MPSLSVHCGVPGLVALIRWPTRLAIALLLIASVGVRQVHFVQRRGAVDGRPNASRDRRDCGVFVPDRTVAEAVALRVAVTVLMPPAAAVNKPKAVAWHGAPRGPVIQA